MSVTIDITTILSPDLKSTSAADDLLLFVKNTSEKFASIDFANVKFVTRSFIEEFHDIFLRNEDIDMKVELLNVSNDIQKVFDTVSKTQNKTKNISNKGSVVPFDNMNDYLKMLPI